MFLGEYHFDDGAGVLMAAYGRLMQGFPPEPSDLHIYVERTDGIAIYDAVLPALRIEGLGDVPAARLLAGVEA